MTFGKKTAACCIAAFAGLSGLTALPAFAGQQETQVAIRYDDLNLSHPAGVQALVVRLHQGAKQACGGAPSLADLNNFENYRACVKESMDKAVAAIGLPMVSQAYQNMSDHPVFLAGN